MYIETYHFTIVDQTHLGSQFPCTDSLPGFKDSVEAEYHTQCTVRILPDSEHLERRRNTSTIMTHETMCMTVMKGGSQGFSTLIGGIDDTGDVLKT
jgi:hypothetical protein